jgi:hypothetical protein
MITPTRVRAFRQGMGLSDELCDLSMFVTCIRTHAMDYVKFDDISEFTSSMMDYVRVWLVMVNLMMCVTIYVCMHVKYILF